MSWLGADEYAEDIEADCWRFYRIWVDLSDLVFPDNISSGRLISMMERLPLYAGVLQARAQAEQDRAGGRQTPGSAQSTPGTTVVGSTGAELMSHPELSGLIEYKKV